MNRLKLNSNTTLIAVLIALFILIIGIFVLNPQTKTPMLQQLPTASSTPSTNITITSPTSSTTWQKGQTYQITWTGGGQNNIQAIFLINKAAESYGVSVSLADRIYNVPNTGSYTYTVPTNIPTGEYKLEIDTAQSAYFMIK